MTTEERAMYEKCKVEYTAMLSRLDQVIRDKWPETLAGDGSGVWAWLLETRAETMQKLTGLRKRLEVSWLNGMFEEMKALTLEWGKLTLEIFREYAQHLKRLEAA
jgi:hypothetical protein